MSLLSDELLRHLIGVGHVDIVVGVPGVDHAETDTRALDVVDQGLMQYFPRARTVVIGMDSGSNDRTLELVSDASAIAGARSGGLRTRHRVFASYRDVPGRSGAVRLVFTAADLLQAQAIGIYDPDPVGLVPESIGALLQPISTQALDLVAAVHARHPLEGLLVTQIVRPLMRALYTRHFEQPLLGVFACSRRFAAGCLAQDVWDRTPLREGIDVWLAGTALAEDYRLGQTPLGRLPATRRASPTLQAIFGPLVGALFATLDKHHGAWIQSGRSAAVAMVGGESSASEPEAPPLNPSGLGTTFLQNVQDLHPVLEQILTAETFAAISAIAAAAEGTDVVRYDDDTWVATLYDFVAAHHHGVIDRMHIVHALMPLYLGRVASFVAEHAASPTTDIEQRLERLAQQFELRRQYLIDRWHRTT